MSKAMWAVLAAAMLMIVPGCAPAYEQVSVGASYSSPGYSSPGAAMDASYFYEPLSAYGRWVDCGYRGWCWTPYDVSADWRPYSEGQWAYTDLGWAWVSDEPWGWACYHYGRWMPHPDYGWVWVPGTEWAPAWVAWRVSDDWVGWAPLPPEASWSASFGLRFSSDRIAPQSWCFVASRSMGEERPALEPMARSVTLVARTRDATRFQANQGRPVNIGVDPERIRGASGRVISTVRIVDAPSAGGGGDRQMGAGAIGFFRPQLRPGRRMAPRPEIRGGDEARGGVAVQPSPPDAGQLEANLSAQREALKRIHERELNAPPAGVSRDQLMRQHADEQRALEDHAAQVRHVIETRWKKNVRKPDHERGEKSRGM